MFKTHKAVALALSALLLAGCGGGGGGSSAPPDFSKTYPVVVPGNGFALDAIASPPEHPASAGMVQGQVMSALPATATGGLLVELLDASTPTLPRPVASTRTASDGSFSLADAATDLQASDRWVRVTLADGSTLRSYAAGWTWVTPGSDVAVGEIARLRQAAAFATRPLTVRELGSAQDAVSLLWSMDGSNLATSSAITAESNFIRTHAPWNRMLSAMAQTTPAPGPNDVAGLIPRSSPPYAASWPASWTSSDQVAPLATTMAVACNGPITTVQSTLHCGMSTQADSNFNDLIDVDSNGISITSGTDRSDPLDPLRQQLGAVKLLDFPYAVGTTVLVDSPRLALNGNPAIHASARITRRCYPLEAVAAMGRTVYALRVTLDYELATFDTTTGKQIDGLTRETRWLVPEGGPIRVDRAVLRRDGSQITSKQTSLVATAPTQANFFDPPSPPFSGLVDVVALGVAHRHAVVAPTLHRVYVASGMNGDLLLELDGDTLTTLRSLQVPSGIGRLAISTDGQSLYAGIDGGSIQRFSTTTLLAEQKFSLGQDADGHDYDRVVDLAVDPHDASRILVLAKSTQGTGFGNVLTYQAGVAVLHDQPGSPSCFTPDPLLIGFTPMKLAWTTTPGEFFAAFLGSPEGLYRFHVGATSYDLVSALPRIDDIGLRDVDGEIVTAAGVVRDAVTLAQKRRLQFAPFALTGCDSRNSSSDFCSLDLAYSQSPPLLVLFDHDSSAFIGSYSPPNKPYPNGCPNQGQMAGSIGLENAAYTPTGDGRLLVTALEFMRSDGELYRCALHVWSLHGTQR